MHTQNLIDYFNTFIPLTQEEETFLKNVFQERKVKKRQFLLSQGEVCTKNSFVVEGCFRMYTLDEKGKEHNLQFATENWWIGDIGSFHSEQPSNLYIEALEHAIILQIKKEDQLKLFVEYPKFNQIFRVFTENALVSSQHRILQNISSTAEERYRYFANKHPELLQRISNVQIASYIGVTPEFLSKIRKDITLK